MAELGLYTGVFVVSNSHELYNHREQWQPYRPGLSVGLRGGFYPLKFLGAEVEGGIVPLRTDGGGRAMLYTIRGHALFQLPLFSAVPFILGGGGVTGTTGALGPDIDPSFHFGGGVKAYLNHWFGIRVDARGLPMPARTLDGGYTLHSELLFSVVITLNRQRRDNDNDGFHDPRQRSRREDACPATPGVRDLRGCPDLDGDGITDSEDICPRKPGSKTRKGCPELLDTDGDGYFDPRQFEIPPGKKDLCPGVAGVPEYTGCPVPDSDDDRVDDLHDKCIDKPETINGYQDADGCPDKVPKQVRKILGRIQGIQFGFLRANLTENSKPIIASAAKVLAKYPDLRLEIQGHTDSDGNPEKNLELSRRRAEAVRTELINAGLPEHQVTAVGYGGDKPISSNQTEEGRSVNRRIEFRLLDQDGRALEVPGGKKK